MGLLIAPQFSPNVLEFASMDEQIASLRIWVGERVLTVVCVYAPNNSSEYPPFLKSLEKVLESTVTGDSIILLGDRVGYRGAWILSGPCSTLPMLRWLLEAVVARLLVLFVEVTPGPVGRHQR